MPAPRIGSIYSPCWWRWATQRRRRLPPPLPDAAPAPPGAARLAPGWVGRCVLLVPRADVRWARTSTARHLKHVWMCCYHPHHHHHYHHRQLHHTIAIGHPALTHSIKNFVYIDTIHRKNIKKARKRRAKGCVWCAWWLCAWQWSRSSGTIKSTVKNRTKTDKTGEVLVAEYMQVKGW